VEKVIEFKNGLIQQTNQRVLENVNFEIQSDELLFLIGKTGSGKSSLMKVLYGELPLSDGTATVAGFDINKLTRKQIPFLRRKIGIVFQDYQLLFDRTVIENLLFVMRATGWKDKREMENRAKTVLDMVGLEGKANLMPHRLSGGEQQRVAIARALVNHPKLILADEPTGNLDTASGALVQQILRDLAHQTGKAVVAVTHDPVFASSADRRIMLIDGKINPDLS
jgi:cell division transport system ATP-binding protein